MDVIEERWARRLRMHIFALYLLMTAKREAPVNYAACTHLFQFVDANQRGSPRFPSADETCRLSCILPLK